MTSAAYEERRLRHLSAILVRGLHLPATEASSSSSSHGLSSASPRRRPLASRRSTSNARRQRASSVTSVSVQDEVATTEDDDEARADAASSPSSSRRTLDSPTASRPSLRQRTQSTTSNASFLSSRSTATLRRRGSDIDAAAAADEATSTSPYFPRRAHSVADEKRHRLHSGWTKAALAQATSSRLADCFVTLSFADATTPFFVTRVSEGATNHTWGAREGSCQPIIDPRQDFADWSIEGDDEEQGLRSLDLGVVLVELWARGSDQSLSRGKARGSSDKGQWAKVWGRKVDLAKLRKVSLDEDRETPLPPNSVILGLANLPPLAPDDDDAGPADSKSKDTGSSRSKRTKSRHAASTTASKTSYYLVTPPPFLQSSQQQPHLARRRSSARRKLGRSASSRRTRGAEGASSDVETSSRLEEDDDEGAASDDMASEPEMSRSDRLEPAEGEDEEESKTHQRRRPQLQRALETREVLELSLRETKMMPSYDADDVLRLLQTQRKLEIAREEVLREAEGVEDGLWDAKGEHALRLRRSHVEEEVRRLSAERDGEVESLKAARKDLTERSEALARRRARLETARRAQVALRGRISKDEEDVKNLESSLDRISTRVQRRRVTLLHGLDFIYPIELRDATSLLFTIVGVALPNGVASEVSTLQAASKRAPKAAGDVVIDEATISTAYGFVGQLIMLLSSYLCVPIPYPIAIAGSRGVILDPISIMSGPRTFPLYYLHGSVEPYRFEYGAFLLNKDVQFLMALEGVQMVDVRHTLANVKNLLVSTASRRGGTGSRERGKKAAMEAQRWRGSRDVIALPYSREEVEDESKAEEDQAPTTARAAATATQAQGTIAAASGWTMSLLGWKSAAPSTTASVTASTTVVSASQQQQNGVVPAATTADEGAKAAGKDGANGSGTAAVERERGREIPTLRKLGASTAATATGRRGWLG